MKKLLAALIIALALPVISLAGTYWVATDGDNGAAGSEAEPWLTIDHAMSTVTAGDTVYVKTGNYPETVTVDNTGSVGSYITLAAADGETPIINFVPWSEGVLRMTGKSYIIVDGIGFSGTAANESIAVRGPASNIIIRNCMIRNTAGDACIYVTGSSGAITHLTIDNCTIHDVDTGWQEVIRVRQNVRYFKITNNTIYNHSNIGIDCVAWTLDTDNMPTYGLIEGNLVYDSTDNHDDGSGGIYLDGANHVCIQNNTVTACVNGIGVGAENDGTTSTANIVRRNFVYGNHRMGVSWGGSNADNGRTRLNSIYHNDFYGNSTDAWSGEISSRYILDGNIVKNNIVYNTNNNQRVRFWVKVGCLGDSITANYNCWHIDTGNYAFIDNDGGDYYTSLSAWQAAVSPNEANSINDNPLFTNGDARNFILQSESPCINTGGPLADTTDGGTGTAISVDNAAPFTDGYNGLFAGDVIRVGLNSAVTITNVDVDANTITVNTSISWITGDPVYMNYSGSAPDMGALEYEEPTPSTRKRWRLWILGDVDKPMQ